MLSTKRKCHELKLFYEWTAKGSRAKTVTLFNKMSMYEANTMEIGMFIFLQMSRVWVSICTEPHHYDMT